MSLREISIGELVNKCKTWNPQKSEKTTFDYIDLSSVDKDLKAIVSTERIQCSDAPSRARQLVEKDDILISTVRPNLNGVAQVKDNHVGMTASTGYCILRPKPEKLDSNYLFQWVKTESFIKKMVDVAIGANYPAVSDSKVKESAIPLPPLPEQKRIAAILDAADALRTQRRQSIAELDLLLQSTFLEMFGDPVENPKGWERCELGSFIEVLTDYHANGSYEILREHVQLKNTKDYALMIRTTDLENNTFDSEDNIYIDKHAYEFLVKSQVHGGDIIINKIGSAGKVYLMPNLNKPVSLGMNAFLIRMKPRIGNLFAYFYLTSQYGVSEINKRVKGAVTKTIRKDAIREIPFYVPSKETQNAFTQLSDAITLQKVRLQAHLAELDTLFASLQQRAFNGEL